MRKTPAQVRECARQIAELRLATPNIKQREIAARLGMTRSNVAQYDRGIIKAANGYATR